MIMRILALIGLLTLIFCFNVLFAAIIMYTGDMIEERDDDED